MIVGVLLGIYFPHWLAMMTSLMIIIALAVVLPFLNRYSAVTTVGLSVAFLLIGFSFATAATERLYPDHYTQLQWEEPSFLLAEISTDPLPTKKSVKAEVEVGAIITEADTVESIGRALVYFAMDEASQALQVGDLLMIRAPLNPVPPPRNPASFDYQQYLRHHQIERQLYAKADAWQLIRAGSGLKRSLVQWQHRVMDRMLQLGLEPRQHAIMSALMIGYRHHLQEDQKSAFASAGAMHVLAVSGLHVGIIYLLLMFLLKPLSRVRGGRIWIGALALLALWAYAAITGFSPSVTRAATMFSFLVVGQMTQRETEIYNTLASSALLLLVIDPYLLLEVGFQLSYLAVFGIVWLQPMIYRWFEFRWWLIDKAWALTAVSLAAQLATFPLGLLYFHQFPSYFLLSNLVVIPLASVLLPLGIATLVLGWIPLLGEWLAALLNVLVKGLDLFVQWLESAPGALIYGIDIGIFESVLIYTFMFFSITYLLEARYRHLIAALLSAIALSGFNLMESFHQQQQQGVLIYSINGSDAMDLISGQQHQFYHSSGLDTNAAAMRFNVFPCWWRMGLDAPKRHLLNAGLYMHGRHSVLVLDDQLAINEAVEVDAVLLTSRTAQHPNSLKPYLNADWMILGPNMDYQSRNFWRKMLIAEGVPFHDMRTSGAFALSSSSNFLPSFGPSFPN